MLMLLAKEVVENQYITNLEWVKIGIEGLVTLITVFIGAFLAYIFSRKSDKKKSLDEQEKMHIKELYDALIEIINNYITFKSFARDKATILLEREDEGSVEKAHDDFLNTSRIIAFDLVNISIRFHALLYIRDAEDIPIIFDKLSRNILDDITDLEDVLAVVYEKENPNNEEYDLLVDEVTNATSKTNMDFDLYKELCYQMQQFIFKK